MAAGAVVVGLLVAFAHGYGYHRDELYFLVAGHHLAWSFPDQGPLIPLIAHVMSGIGAGSLTVLRIRPRWRPVRRRGHRADRRRVRRPRRAQLIAAGCTPPRWC